MKDLFSCLLFLNDLGNFQLSVHNSKKVGVLQKHEIGIMVNELNGNLEGNVLIWK